MMILPAIPKCVSRMMATGAQRLALSSTPHLAVVFRREADDMVEIMAADVRLSFGVVLEAG